MPRTSRPIAVVLSWLLLFGHGTVFAGPVTFIGLSGGSFQTASNWNPSAVPGAGDTVILTGAGGGTVGIMFTADATTQGTTVEDSKYQLLLNGYTYTTTDLVIGSPTAAGDLEIAGGTVAMTTTTIGAFALASPGTSVLTVSGSGSQLLTAPIAYNSAGLVVGSLSPGTLNISGGGSVTGWRAEIASTAAASGSTVLVDGQGSQLNLSGNLFVGERGRGSMTIQNGGTVATGPAVIASTSGSAGSTVVVDGAGSQWLSNGLTVGAVESGFLTVRNGGQVTSGFTVAAGQGAAGSAVIVDGTGSRITGSASVGLNGQGSLQIINGGTVSGSAGVIAGFAGSAGSSVIVDGSGSTWNMGGMSTSGLTVGVNDWGTLTIRNGGVASLTGVNSLAQIAASAGSAGSSVTVDGPGSQLQVQGSLTVGFGDRGTLTISNGGVVSETGLNSSGAIGWLAGSGGSAVTVDGAGSRWTMPANLIVGNGGQGSLSISNGGFVSNRGATLSAAGSFASVDGTGSQWVSAGGIDVGSGGAASMSITNGGVVVSGANASSGSRISVFSPASGSSVLVDGAGSMWTNGQSLTVGSSGRGTLSITNGGTVSNTSAVIGNLSGSSGSSVTVDGAGSRWTNSSTLFVGAGGASALTITNGGAVSNTNGTIAASGGSGSSVSVTGNSQWMNAGTLTVGQSGVGSLLVGSGGVVTTTSNATIASLTGSSGSAVTVSGAGSQWTTTTLTVGANGVGALNVSGGGVVSSSSGTIASQSGASGSSAAVDGAGSQWNSSGDMRVGTSGRGTLSISNGGVVTSRSTIIGAGATTAVGSMATVDGIGSQWVNSSYLRVSSGSLVVGGGGYVQSGNSFFGDSVAVTGAGGIIGRFAPEVSPVASITGPGSLWTMNGSLIVGMGGFSATGLPNFTTGVFPLVVPLSESAGGSGTLTITNGGRVVSSEGAVGFNTGSNGVVIVSGAGSEWKVNAVGTAPVGSGNPCTSSAGISGNLYVGMGGLCTQNGAGTGLLTVSDFGAITANNLIIGATGTVNGDNGIINATVENSGLFSPGLSPGTLTVNGDFNMHAGGTLLLEVGGASLMDLLIINGNALFDPGALLKVSFLNGFLPAFGQSFGLLQLSGTSNLSSFLSNPLNFQVLGLPTGYLYSWSESGGLFSMTTASDTPVPEPGTLLLLGLGLAMLVARRRKLVTKV